MIGVVWALLGWCFAVAFCIGMLADMGLTALLASVAGRRARAATRRRLLAVERGEL